MPNYSLNFWCIGNERHEAGTLKIDCTKTVSQLKAEIAKIQSWRGAYKRSLIWKREALCPTMDDFEVAVSKGNWSSILHDEPLSGELKIGSVFPTAPTESINLIVARSRDSRECITNLHTFQILNTELVKSASLKRYHDELNEDKDKDEYEDIDDLMHKLRKSECVMSIVYVDILKYCFQCATTQ
jgi:hypothetical protein